MNIVPVLPDGRGNALTDITEPTVVPAAPGTGNAPVIIPEGTPPEIAELLRANPGMEVPTTDRILYCGTPENPSGGGSVQLTDREYSALHGPMQERYRQLQQSDPNAPFPPPAANERIEAALNTIDDLCRPSMPISSTPATGNDPHHGLTTQYAGRETIARS